MAPELLGKLLCVRLSEGEVIGRIVETEGYFGDDPASHCSRGKTPRCAPMFEAGGIAYVYFIYGMYEMFNVVTEPADQPGAVLIRALEPVEGKSLMQKRRKSPNPSDWTNGPGKLTRAMGIQMQHNRESLQGPLLKIMDDGFRPQQIWVSPRVGIREATDRFWRYAISDHSFVSRAPQNRLAKPFKIK